MIWLVRHSERTDLEDPQAFVQHKKRFLPSDPSITVRGFDWAYQTGIYLKKQITELHPNKKIVVVSSPYYRCIQTSVQIMKAISNEFLHSNTLLVEDAFQEIYQEPYTTEDTPDNLVYRQILKGDVDLKNEIFGHFDHAHNILLEYSNNLSWQEYSKRAQNRYYKRTQELVECYSRSEFQNTIFVVVGHGIMTGLACHYANKGFYGDYCVIFNFNLEKNNEIVEDQKEKDTEIVEDQKEKDNEIVEEQKEKYKWTLLNGEKYGYDRISQKDITLFYINHSPACDEYDITNQEKHIERGLNGMDSPLTAFGKEIAFKTGQELRQMLLSVNFTGKKKFIVISSPYLKCIQTSKSLIDGIGKDLLKHNHLYVEEGFEGRYSKEANKAESTRWQRTFNRFEYDQELKTEFMGDMTFSKNEQLNYEDKIHNINPKWMEKANGVRSRTLKAIKNTQKRINKLPEFEDTMVIIVSHKYHKDIFENITKEKLDKVKSCSINLIKVSKKIIELLKYNEICYDDNKMKENQMDKKSSKKLSSSEK